MLLTFLAIISADYKNYRRNVNDKIDNMCTVKAGDMFHVCRQNIRCPTFGNMFNTCFNVSIKMSCFKLEHVSN